MKSKSSVFEITCECCGAKIHVDGKNRSVFYTEKEGHKTRSFEDVVTDVTSVARRAADKFDETMESERSENKEKALEDLFQKAKKKAQENPEEKPPSIWDYD